MILRLIVNHWKMCGVDETATWRKGPSAVHLGGRVQEDGVKTRAPLTACVAVTGSTGRLLAWRCFTRFITSSNILSIPYSQHCPLHITGKRNEVPRVEVATQFKPQTGAGTTCGQRGHILHEWRRDANTNYCDPDSLGVFQLRCSSWPTALLLRNPSFLEHFLKSLLSLTTDRMVSESKVSYLLVCVVRDIQGQGRQRESFTSRQLAGPCWGRGGLLLALSSFLSSCQQFPPGVVTVFPGIAH